jgi:hypothetical protein
MNTNKMRSSLEKLHQTLLHDVPNNIRRHNIIRAKSDEAKRRLVLAALLANTEMHRRNSEATIIFSEREPMPKEDRPVRRWLETWLSETWKNPVKALSRSKNSLNLETKEGATL